MQQKKKDRERERERERDERYERIVGAVKKKKRKERRVSTRMVVCDFNLLSDMRERIWEAKRGR